MSRRKGKQRSKRRPNRPPRQEREKKRKQEMEMAMNQLHALFIKMQEQFSGCTIAGVAIDQASGAVCIHVEEHNKVMMFHGVQDFAIAEHAGKLRDMLMSAGFLVPEAVMETWNAEFQEMATTYAKAVMAGEQETPEGVNPELIKTILGPYYNPEEAASELERLTGKKDESAESADDETGSEPAEGDVTEEKLAEAAQDAREFYGSPPEKD